MKRIGIVLDNYKLPKFEKEIKPLFTYSVNELNTSTSVIIIFTADDKIDVIKNICKKLEIDIKASN